MTEPCDSTWAINATTILRLLGRDPPPPYGPKVEEKDSSIQFTWLDLSLETPDTLTDPPSDVPMYDSESAVATGQAAAEAEEEWDQELCGDIIHREQLKQIVVIDRLSDLRKEFFSVLLTQLRSAEDEPPEAVDAETQNDVTEAPSTGQAELYTEDRPVIVGPDGQHIDLDDDGAEDAPTVDAEDAYDRRVERTRRKHREENADTEPETERKGPNRHCEREVIDIEQSVDQFRKQAYAAPIALLQQRLAAIASGRLEWEDCLKMGYQRWQKESPRRRRRSNCTCTMLALRRRNLSASTTFSDGGQRHVMSACRWNRLPSAITNKLSSSIVWRICKRVLNVLCAESITA